MNNNSKIIKKKIPKHLWLVLDFNKLSIEECSFIKVNSPCVFRDDIPPLEKWYPINFRKMTDYDIEIMKYDFPILFKKVVNRYHVLKKQKILN
jgi:hypothetical protein|tara:strand:+ start:521 stop:799 length:279 start_codon:yes stop_codon:yes gene_type:complete